jgi:PAS domain S-box-containing protein
MKAIFSRKLGGAAEIRRVEMLFERQPSSVVAAMIGIFLCFLVLFNVVGLEILKGWVAYMLTVFAVRLWVWYMFGKADRQSTRIHRWEWVFAGGVFLTSIGWGALFGPLHPPSTAPDAGRYIFLIVTVIVFTGAVFLALSNIAFWLFTIPVLLFSFAHYASVGHTTQWTVPAAVCGLIVLILVQRTLYRSATDNLQRSTEAEALLEEQQGIFDSSPLGIAVIDNKQVVKCNARLGDMLGRRIQDLTTASLQEHFVSTEEANQFLADRASAFDRGHLAQGLYRLRRADGSEFWAEFSGRKMAGGPTHSVWMIADVTLRVANERRSQQRD